MIGRKTSSNQRNLKDLKHLIYFICLPLAFSISI